MMTKIFEVFLSIAICFIFLCAGCQNSKSNHFSYIKPLLTKSEKIIIDNNHVLSVSGVMPFFLNRHITFLGTKGFNKWNHLISSEGALLKVDQQTIFNGELGKPVLYSISNERCGKYTPIILLDEKAMILYCVLSTDFGG